MIAEHGIDVHLSHQVLCHRSKRGDEQKQRGGTDTDESGEIQAAAEHRFQRLRAGEAREGAAAPRAMWAVQGHLRGLQTS